MKKGETILTIARIVYKNSAEKTGRKVQIEVREQTRELSLLSAFNEGDDRFKASGARPAWIIMEVDMFKKFFGANIDAGKLSAIDTMGVSTGTKSDTWTEGIHYVKLDIDNPTIDFEGVPTRLRVQITESLLKPYENASPKINPTTKQEITHLGASIYSTTEVVPYEPVHTLLEADVSTKTAPLATAVEHASNALIESAKAAEVLS